MSNISFNIRLTLKIDISFDLRNTLGIRYYLRSYITNCVYDIVKTLL